MTIWVRIPSDSFVLSLTLRKFNMFDPRKEIFENNILPIIVKVDNLLKDEKVDFEYGLLALATLLATKLGELEQNPSLQTLLARFDNVSIDNNVKKNKESN